MSAEAGCKGAWGLNNNCGVCDRCLATMPENVRLAITAAARREVQEDGAWVGFRTADSRRIEHYGLTSVDILAGEVSREGLWRAYQDLERVASQRVTLHDPKVRLEMHFVKGP